MRCSRLAISALAAVPVWAQPAGSTSDIPDDGMIVERTELPSTVHKDRELVLWMIAPTKHDRGPLSGNPYTCPEWTLGSYYQGPTRLSLLDKKTGRVINTIKLISSLGDTDEFNVPYRILSGFYYAVPGVPKGSEGTPGYSIFGIGTATEFRRRPIFFMLKRVRAWRRPSSVTAQPRTRSSNIRSNW